LLQFESDGEIELVEEWGG